MQQEVTTKHGATIYILPLFHTELRVNNIITDIWIFWVVMQVTNIKAALHSHR